MSEKDITLGFLLQASDEEVEAYKHYIGESIPSGKPYVALIGFFWQVFHQQLPPILFIARQTVSIGSN
jgi:hypothetical protein